MQELGRDVYSGAMTRWLKQQPLQDKLFPAEDIITVQNLLTRPAPGMFRGPSRKLLSFHILVGDSYVLPSTLSRYEQDLLSKVDSEIQCKSSRGKETVSPLTEKEGGGEICHRVFCEVDLRCPESPERVYGEAAGIFDTSAVEPSEDGVCNKTQSGSSADLNLPSPAGSLSDTNLAVVAVSEGSVDHQTETVAASKNDNPPNRPPPAKLPQTVSKTGSDAVLMPAAKSPLHGSLSKAGSDSTLSRKLSRIGTSHGQPGPGNLQRSAMPGNPPRAAVPGNPPRSAVSGNPPRAAVPRNPPKATVSGNPPRASVPRNPPKAAVSGNPPRASVPRNPPKAAVSGNPPRTAVPRNPPRTAAPGNSAVIGNQLRTAVSGNPPKTAVSGNSPRTAAPGNSAVTGNPPRTAVSGNPPKTAVSGNPPRTAAPGNSAATGNPPKTAVSGNPPKTAVSGNPPRAAAPGNLAVTGNPPKTAVSGNPPKTAVSGNPPRAAAPGNLAATGNPPKTAVSGNSPRTAAPGNSPRTSVPRAAVPKNPSGAAVQGNSKTSVSGNSSQSVAGAAEGAAAVPPRGAGRGPRPTAPRTLPRQAAQAGTVQQPASTCAVMTSGTSSTVVGASVQTAAAFAPTAKQAVLAAPTQSPQIPATAQQAKLVICSARDEWELSARGKQSAGGGPVSLSAVEAVGKTVVPEAQGNQSQGASQGIEPMVMGAAPAAAPSSVGDGSESGDDGKKKGSGDQDAQCRAEALGSGDSFIPPGLTLLSSGSCPAEHPPRKDRPAEHSDEQTTVTQQSTVSSTPQGPAPSQQKEDMHKPSESSPQAQKRLHTPQSSTPDVEPKKALLDLRVSKPDSATWQPRPSGNHRDKSYASPERNLIHRPWQAREEGREPHGPATRKPDRAEGHRDAPRFDRTQDKPSHSFDGRDDWQRLRGWGDRLEMGQDRTQDMGHQRLQHMEDRGGPRSLSAMERERAAAQTRVFDYDHQDRVVSEDFVQHRNLGLAQGDPRTIPTSAATRFENLRHLALDLSEQRRHLELPDRDMFAAGRLRSLGRESSLGLEHGAIDSWAWRGPLQRQPLQQPGQQQHPPRSELQAGLRNPLRSDWPRGQGLRGDTQRTLELQSHLMDRHFPSLEGRDPRVDFRGDAMQGQFPRDFSLGRARRPFDFWFLLLEIRQQATFTTEEGSRAFSVCVSDKWSNSTCCCNFYGQLVLFL